MLSGLQILRTPVEGLVNGADPKSLSGAHPAWAADIAALGPWTPCKDDPQARFCSPARQGFPGILVCGECSSALDVAWRFLGSGDFGEWGSVLAVSQWSGRGRQRRQWHSPPGNVYGVLALPRMPEGLARMSSLLVGLLFAEALEDLVPDIKIKWPNDLLWRDRKVGGVLVEERGGSAVAGTGINLFYGPSVSDGSGDCQTPGTLDKAGVRQGPVTLWTKLVDHARYGYGVVSQLPEGRLAALVEKRLAWLGREISVYQDHRPFSAILTGLDAQGGLRVLRNGREEVLFTGSIRQV